MKLSWDEIQANAVVFSKRWKDASNEEASGQSFGKRGFYPHVGYGVLSLEC